MAVIGEMKYLTIGGSTYSIPIPIVPTNVSAFTNDAGYITSADVPEGASAYTGTIKEVGTSASTGSNNGFARGDHVHNITNNTIRSALGNQTAHYVLIGPSSGNATTPTFRKLVASDIPDLSDTYLTSYTETDPNVPDWAKAANKPNYSLSEITGADDVQAIESLTGTSGFLKKTAANTWSLDTTTYLTSSSTLSAAKLSGTIPTSCYTNSNTTYTLTNALSSHKFTWTFTAGGSGSGSTTTTAELVAGTGITLTDDTTNKKITIASSVTNTDDKVKQTNTTTSATYELLFSYTADNTERTEGARKTSTLTYNPSTKALSTGGTVNGYTLAAASAKGVDTSIASGSSSANLPTSAAVASYVSSNATQVQIVRW